MKTTAEIFKDELAKVQDDVKIQLDISYAIADKIDLALKQQHISKKEFARKMGKSEEVVSSWLSGTHNFTVRTIAKISAALGVQLIPTP